LLFTALNLVTFNWSYSQSQKPTEVILRAEYTIETLAGLKSYSFECEGEIIDLALPVREIARAIEKANLRYRVKPLTDCSGIFHRVLKIMKKRCPDFTYPPIEKYRSTRALARWYHEKGRLILVRDAIAYSGLIKPGAVMFFGQRYKTYKNFSAKDLFKRGSGINHIGLVVKVHYDKTGNVSSYELLHGHGKTGRTPASVTKYHRRLPTRATYPPYGNGTEQWVALAILASPTLKILTNK
jgi:hypothetical protein